MNGAAAGYLGAVLNHFTPSARLPRVRGIATTLNEVTYVLGPVVASGLGAVSPVFAVLALTLLVAIPALLVPQAHSAHLGAAPHAEASVLRPAILLWLGCAAAAHLAEAGCRSVFLWVLWVLWDNPSRWLYARLGGRPAAEAITQVGGQPVAQTAFVWDPIEKLLAASPQKS